MSGDRRRFLRAFAGSVALGLLPGRPHAAAVSGAAPALPSHPFRLGVASGYPTDHSVVLWTRLAPVAEQPDGGMPPPVSRTTTAT